MMRKTWQSLDLYALQPGLLQTDFAVNLLLLQSFPTTQAAYAADARFLPPSDIKPA
jgi:hypothetical protein